MGKQENDEKLSSDKTAETPNFRFEKSFDVFQKITVDSLSILYKSPQFFVLFIFLKNFKYDSLVDNLNRNKGFEIILSGRKFSRGKNFSHFGSAFFIPLHYSFLHEKLKTP